jgi:cysteine sulfinate desulfinase/cysteine desulfurase-like protein
VRSQQELKEYIHLLCTIYYNKNSVHFKSSAIRYFIDRAKKQLRGEVK